MADSTMPRHSPSGLPLSAICRRASDSFSATSPSAILLSTSARLCGSSSFQPEWWKACQARSTAASSSSMEVTGTRAISSPVAGLVLMSSLMLLVLEAMTVLGNS